jgi:hypothetical protein
MATVTTLVMVIVRAALRQPHMSTSTAPKHTGIHEIILWTKKKEAFFWDLEGVRWL